MRVAPNIYRNSCSDWAGTLIKKKKSRSCSVSNHKSSVSMIVFGRKNKLALKQDETMFLSRSWASVSRSWHWRSSWGWVRRCYSQTEGRSLTAGQKERCRSTERCQRWGPVCPPPIPCVCVRALMMRHNCMSDYTRGCVYVYTLHIRLVFITEGWRLAPSAVKHMNLWRSIWGPQTSRSFLSPPGEICTSRTEQPCRLFSKNINLKYIINNLL